MADSLLPPLDYSLAGWRCHLTADTASGHAALIRLFGSALASGLSTPAGRDAISTFGVFLADGPFPRLRWQRGEQPGDFSALFAGPDGKRFVPVAHPARRLYADCVTGSGAALELRDGGELRVLCPDQWPLYAAHALAWIMRREHPVAALHAAVCAASGVALLIVGPSGCGKSTLSYALARQGADYFSDEAALLTLPDCRLFVSPQPVSLRPGGVAALAAFPDAPAWREAKPGDPKCVPVLPPPAAPCPSDPLVLLFAGGFGDAPRLSPLGGGEAARRLAFVLGCGGPSPLARLETAADIVSRLPCRLLTLGSPEDTAALLIAQARGMAWPTR